AVRLMAIGRSSPSGEDQQGYDYAEAEKHVEGAAIEHQSAQDVAGDEVGLAGAEAGEIDQFAIIEAGAAQLEAEGAGEGGFGPAGIGGFVLARISDGGGPGGAGAGMGRDEASSGDKHGGEAGGEPVHQIIELGGRPAVIAVAGVHV